MHALKQVLFALTGLLKLAAWTFTRPSVRSSLLRESLPRSCADLKRGPTSWFQFSFFFAAYSDITEKVSETFEIGKLAKIQLRCKYSFAEFYICLSYRKNELAGNALTKINFSSKTLNYSADFFCTGTWSEVALGTLKITDIAMKESETDYAHFFNQDNGVVIHTTKMDLIAHVSRDENIISNPLLYEDQDFTDFELIAADGSVAVHKACLAARSDVFRRMFAGEWKETVEGGVDMKHVSKQTLQDLKDFIYMGKLPEDRLRPLIVVAKKYMITDLVEACAKFLAETVLPEDLNSLHELAGHNLPELSCAITELTPDRVIHEAYEIKMAKSNTALTTDTK